MYQGIIGLTFILLLFIGIERVSFTMQETLPVADRFVRTDTVYIDQLNVINSLEIIEQQKIGRSVNEDSMLTRFLYSIN